MTNIYKNIEYNSEDEQHGCLFNGHNSKFLYVCINNSWPLIRSVSCFYNSINFCIRMKMMQGTYFPYSFKNELRCLW